MTDAAPTRSFPPLALLAERTRTSDGCFLLAEALAAGLSRRVLARLVRDGTVERAHPGVYRFCAHAWTWEAKQRAAVLAAGPGACASHAGAARWLGLDGVPTGSPEVTVLGKDLLIEGSRTHRTRSLEPSDVTEVRGLRCTTGSRTLIDLAARLPRERLIAAVDSAICAGIAHRGNLHDRAVALQPGRRGVQHIVAVTAPGAEGIFWSSFERGFGTLVAGSDLPTPSYNARVEHNGRTFVVDALWPGVVVELEGLQFHSTPDQRRRDDERRNALAEQHLIVLVFAWAQLVESPGEVLSTVRAALAGGASAR